MIRKKLLTAALVAVFVLGMTGAASALTGWKTFGGGTFYSRGTSTSYGFSPINLLSSTTQKNPYQIRLTVAGGPTARKVDIQWELACDGPKGFVYRTNGSGITSTVSATKPWVRTWTRTNDPFINRGNPTFCELSVWAHHTNYSNTDAPIKTTFQARYP